MKNNVSLDVFPFLELPKEIWAIIFSYAEDSIDLLKNISSFGGFIEDHKDHIANLIISRLPYFKNTYIKITYEEYQFLKQKYLLIVSSVSLCVPITFTLKFYQDSIKDTEINIFIIFHGISNNLNFDFDSNIGKLIIASIEYDKFEIFKYLVEYCISVDYIDHESILQDVEILQIAAEFASKEIFCYIKQNQFMQSLSAHMETQDNIVTLINRAFAKNNISAIEFLLDLVDSTDIKTDLCNVILLNTILSKDVLAMTTLHNILIKNKIVISDVLMQTVLTNIVNNRNNELGNNGTDTTLLTLVLSYIRSMQEFADKKFNLAFTNNSLLHLAIGRQSVHLIMILGQYPEVQRAGIASNMHSAYIDIMKKEFGDGIESSLSNLTIE